jgi:hypothetical protein
MTWITTAQIPVPQWNDYAIKAEFMLVWDVFAQLQNPVTNFATSTDADKASPQTFMASMVMYAYSLTQNNYQQKLAPAGWNWAQAGIKAAASCFGYLSQLPMQAGDENSASVMQAWVNVKGGLYGGHDPISSPPVTSGDGTNTATGQAAVTPAGGPSIL